MTEPEKLKWLKQQTLANGYEVLEARETDPVKDFKMEPSGHYVLIKILSEGKKIALSICNPKHELLKTFQGTLPRDILTALFIYEADHKFQWFQSKDHIAYLGKELANAYHALQTGNKYVQE